MTVTFLKPAPPKQVSTDRLDKAFELGWDYAHHGVTPPMEHLQAIGSLQSGWQAGRATFGRRTLRADRFVRKWLQLRLHAWQRGRAFDEGGVNPTFLRQIDAPVCPITREVLTHCTGEVSDASVDRVFNDAGYAIGNLAVMSTRANFAKGSLDVCEALKIQQEIMTEQIESVRSLTGAQWGRVAVLASFATTLPHSIASRLPLTVLPPNRLRVLNPVQALQVLINLQLTVAGHARRGAELTALMPSSETRLLCQEFIHTLLARRLTSPRLSESAQARHALEDVWLDPLLNKRWQRLSCRLSKEQCESIVRAAVARGHLPGGARLISDEMATECWAIESRGYDPAGSEREGPDAPAIRSVGSHNLALPTSSIRQRPNVNHAALV